MPTYNHDDFDPPAPVALVDIRDQATGKTVAHIPMLMDTVAYRALELPMRGGDMLILCSDAEKNQQANVNAASPKTRSAPHAHGFWYFLRTYRDASRAEYPTECPSDRFARNGGSQVSVTYT
jgi:hypothetical protein